MLADFIRWTATSFISSLIGLFAFQILHGFVVVGLFIGMQIYVENEIPLTLRSTGQTLLGMTIGLGSVVFVLLVRIHLRTFQHSNTLYYFKLPGFDFICFNLEIFTRTKKLVLNSQNLNIKNKMVSIKFFH